MTSAAALAKRAGGGNEKPEFFRTLLSHLSLRIGDQRASRDFFQAAFWRLQGELDHNLQALFCPELFLCAQDIGCLKPEYLSTLIVFSESSSVLGSDSSCNRIIKIWIIGAK